MRKNDITKIVLAYSGGLDTTVALHWLTKTYDAEVIAYCAGLGQPDDLEEVRRKALAGGASKVVIEDLRDIYLTDYVFPALRAGALYEGQYTMAAPIGRPLIAKRLAEVALAEGAQAVAHGSTGKGNDQVRFYSGVIRHAPNIQMLAPCIDWELSSRDDEIAYAKTHGLEISAQSGNVFSMDGSIWGTSTECGILEDPNTAAPHDAFQLTRSPQEAPDQAERITVGFSKGMPVTLDGTSCTPISLVEKLSEMGGRHGIGRVDIVENSLLGIKTRAIYESPAGSILHRAHRELEAMTLERDVLHYKAGISQRYAQLVYFGQWFSALKSNLDAFVDSTQQDVSGEIELELYKGTISIIARKPKRSLYLDAYSVHDHRDAFDHPSAVGFAYIHSLPQRIQAMADEEATDD